MSEKNIVISGAAGFIGMHLSISLLEDGYNIFGIDNLNDYYDRSLKKSRLNKLYKYSNFSFSQIDIEDFEKLKSVFKIHKPTKVVNLAAQVGVRYSLKNPHAYIGSNITGFTNIIELCKMFSVSGLVYASSSSVYGANQKIPFSMNDRTDKPISLYAVSKKTNELIAYTYSHLYNLKTIGLRFFTVYGPWGRPDMAMYIFTKNIINGEEIPVFNGGDMKRDFTFIDDIIYGLRASLDSDYQCEVFNLGNNKSENLMDMIKIIEEELNSKAKIQFHDMQPGDVRNTFADISHAKELLGYSPKIAIEEGIPQFIDWYKIYYQKK